MQQLNARLHGRKQPPYIVNLDPAVKHVPFDRNIDIRDSVNYREVMAQYNLGPNGGIVTSLNLFATKMDQVVGILERRAATGSISRVLVDTPGQIECFVWSASGSIITDALASAFPTVLAYIIDTPRTAKPATFMANMLYACSILYKTKLPMVLVFNKTDVHDAAFAREWMTDFEAFQRALRASEQPAGGGEDALGGSGYMSSLLNSMSLVLDEFYNHLDLVAVSATRDIGIDDFLEAVDAKVLEYERDYRPEMERARARRDQDKQNQQQRELDRLMKDMHVHKDPKIKKGEKAQADDDDDDDADVVSDVESSCDGSSRHGLVDRDEDERDAMDEDKEADDDDNDDADTDDETLRQRYEKRFAESAGGNSGRGADKKETRAGLESLSRYLRATSSTNQ